VGKKTNGRVGGKKTTRVGRVGKKQQGLGGWEKNNKGWEGGKKTIRAGWVGKKQ
jgi:hypothetical protein